MLHDKIHYILFIETHARLLRLNTFDDSPLLPDPNVFIYAVSLRNSFMFCLWESGFWSGYFKPRCFSYYSVLNLILSASFRLWLRCFIYVTYKLFKSKATHICCAALHRVVATEQRIVRPTRIARTHDNMMTVHQRSK